MRTILLVDPGTDFAEGGTRHATRQTPHIGLCYLAMVLKDHAKTRMIDMPLMGTSIDELKSEIQSLKNGDVVGITTATFNVQEAIEAAEIVKKINPKILTLAGGPHVNAFPTDILIRSIDFDAAIVGEGEKLIVEITNHHDEDAFDWNLPGVAYRKDGEIVFTPVSGDFIFDNMDDLPFLDWNYLRLNKYWKRYSAKFDQIVQMAPLSTNRGCPYQCSFCDGANLTKKLRWRSAQHVVDEIAYSLEKFGLRHYYITDSVMCIPKPRFKQFCELMVSSGLNDEVSFLGQAQINSIDEDSIYAFAEAGGEYIFFGLESGNEEVLAKNGKPIKKERVVSIVNAAYESGLHPRGSFILGLPYETEKSALDTIEFAHQLKLHTANFFILDFYPGTRAKVLLEDQSAGFYLPDGGIDWDSYVPSRSKAHVGVNDLTSERLEELLAYARSLPMPYQDHDLMLRQTSLEFAYLANEGVLDRAAMEKWYNTIQKQITLADSETIDACRDRLRETDNIYLRQMGTKIDTCNGSRGMKDVAGMSEDDKSLNSIRRAAHRLTGNIDNIGRALFDFSLRGK